MDYRTLLVHLHVGQSNKHLLALTGDLATRLKAGVIGIAAARPMDLIYSEGYVPAEAIEADRQTLETEMAAAEAEFHDAFSDAIPVLGWRSVIGYERLANLVANEARSADLVIVPNEGGSTAFNSERRADAGELIMQTGRPVLLVPPDLAALNLHRVAVGWKDTREARRALFDALPLLAMAGSVDLVAIVSEQEAPDARKRMDEVAAWLRRHAIMSNIVVESSDDAAAVQRFGNIVDRGEVGLVVAGAYGHSRVREWAFGGFTRNLLLNGKTCALVSH